METKYPALRRPKGKLCYFTQTKSSSDQRQRAFTLEDVDTMFDDIDVCKFDPRPPSVLLQSSDSGTSQTDLDIPFTTHDPVKTSSPIEQKTFKNGMEESDDESNRAVSPVLFNCEDEEVQEPEKDPLPTQEPLCNGDATEKSDVDLESPLTTITLTRKLSHKEVEKPSCPESTEPSSPAARNKPSLSPPEQNSESVLIQSPAEKCSRVGNNKTAFLQTLRLAIQPKPKQKSFSKAPPPPPHLPSPPPRPEPDDDFLILEDDTPLWVTIPSKTATKRKERLNKTSSIDKESSTDKGSKDSSPEMPQEEQQLEKINNKQGNQGNNQTVKRKRRKEKNNQVTGSGKDEDDKDSLPSPKDHPAGNSVEQQKRKKKEQQPKKVPLKESKEVKDLPEDGGDAKPEKTPKAETKAHKSTKRKTLKDEKKITKSGMNTLKKPKKAPQRSNAEEEGADIAVGERSDGEPADVEDMGSFPEKEILKPEADGKTRQNKLSDVSEEHSPQDDQVLGKRERKQTGQWWLLSSEGTESPQPLKKSKNNSKEPRAAAPSTGQAKKDKVHKNTNQKWPASLSGENMNKCKQTKKRKAKEEMIKETEEVICAAEIPDEGLDQEQSSPLVFPQRNISLSSRGQIFQKVYLKSTNETPSVTATAPVPPIQHEDQLKEAEAANWRSEPLDSEWKVNDAADYSGGIASPPRQRPPKEPKPLKEQRRQTKQGKTGRGSRKNCKVAARAKPPGGAVVSPVKPLLTPKTAKRSLATFKDIFSSDIGTPTGIANRDAHQSTRRNVTSRPAERAHDTVSVTDSRADKKTLTGDVGDWRSPQDGECGDEDMLKFLRSGPSSMIELENYDNNDDMDLPSSRVQRLLSAADLCAPPLRPLTLHAKDKSNLTEWFQSLWSSTADGNDSAAVTPDQFQWYFYQDRALGIQVDLNSSSVCSGKILMGSYMKKPLWVDHSATTIFNLLTSSVSVTVDGSASRYGPGQAFMVECGRAYSIQNTNSQPAVLYFTRMLAESED